MDAIPHAISFSIGGGHFSLFDEGAMSRLAQALLDVATMTRVAYERRMQNDK